VNKDSQKTDSKTHRQTNADNRTAYAFGAYLGGGGTKHVVKIRVYCGCVSGLVLGRLHVEF